MIKGFGILEMLVSLSLGLGILTVIIAHATETGRVTKKITSNQERLEAIFHTVDTIKLDLNKCGMRLQEAGKYFSVPGFESSPGNFKVTYGLAEEPLLENALTGQQTLKIAKNEFYKKDKVILMYNLERQAWAFNEIGDLSSGTLILKSPLQDDFPRNSQVLVLKKVEYKFYPAQRMLKRKTDKGNFQPLLEEVTDFYVTFFPDANSVLYRIEVNKKEQIRGYIFLLNMVQP
jgi:type II secretory pathway component PulJ